jgi:hypothetical protein
MAGTTNKNSNPRFLDANEEPNLVLLPIRGYGKEPNGKYFVIFLGLFLIEFSSSQFYGTASFREPY